MEHQRVELEENLRRALGACSECPHITPEFWALSRRKQGRLDYTALVRYIHSSFMSWNVPLVGVPAYIPLRGGPGGMVPAYIPSRDQNILS